MVHRGERLAFCTSLLPSCHIRASRPESVVVHSRARGLGKDKRKLAYCKGHLYMCPLELVG